MKLFGPAGASRAGGVREMDQRRLRAGRWHRDPRDSVKTDREVELGVVIGRGCKQVDEANALDYVAGYCVVNDVFEREWQIERGGRWWDKGKGFDALGPIGPWRVTRDEIADPQRLDRWLGVAGLGEQRQQTRAAA